VGCTKLTRRFLYCRFSTAIGGMLLLASGEQSGSIIPDSPSHWMGAFATLLSFINISGGFLVSGKMLDLFRRPEDPKEFFELYGIPTAILLSGLAVSGFLGLGDLSLMSGTASIAASILCISAIAGKQLSVQDWNFSDFCSHDRFHSCSSRQPENCQNGKCSWHGRCHYWTSCDGI
jgi:4TM region of pyridine nucleotide transhydrogenase, mitoch